MEEKKKVYFAAGLFNLADKYFNSELAEALCYDFEVILPQKEGFEFSKLNECLEGIVEQHEIKNAANHLIYYLDLGYLLPRSDFCFARLDEPVDEGVVCEIGHARKFKIPVIGYRTDCRSPYGSSDNEVRGAHFFPAYDCDSFINFSSLGIETPMKGKEAIKQLAEYLRLAALKILDSSDEGVPKKEINLDSGIPYIGNYLFSGIKYRKSIEGLREIAQRYKSLQRTFGNLISTEIVMA
jgi:nucleoside 2-deoxyribosyltransferase